ncbi:MAG: lipoyl(octanoyl) transferase LipB [candidate division WOR-3 bacterium]
MRDYIFLDIGFSNYKEVWDLQKNLHEKRVKGEIPDIIIFTEHNHVYTLGKRGEEKNFKISPSFLKQMGIEIFRVERGGDVTYHGPGQIVGYLIFYIDIGIKKFVNNIEESIIKMLKEYGINGEKNEKNPGVWVNDEKICSIGIAVKKFVSFHGFALNVNTDLRYFDYIFPCGLQKKVTSMEKIIGKKINMEEVKNKLKSCLESIFSLKEVQLQSKLEI